MLEAERQRIVVTAHRLAEQGLVMGTAGNVSLKVGSAVVVTATGAPMKTLTTDQVTVVALDDECVLDGELMPTSELALHLDIYRGIPKANAVIHTHAPWATAIACVADELPCIHYQMLRFGGAIRVAPYHCFGTPELAHATLAALEDRTAALMANHGAVVHADTVEEALESALLLEYMCSLYWHAAQLGKPRTLDGVQLRDVAEQVGSLGYGVTHRLNFETDM